jgi:hypothetical protein
MSEDLLESASHPPSLDKSSPGSEGSKCPDRSESVTHDQEMSQSVQYSDFKPDWWTFSMFLEQLKNYKFWNTGSTLAQQ